MVFRGGRAPNQRSGNYILSRKENLHHGLSDDGLVVSLTQSIRFLHRLRIPNGSYLQGKLRAFVLFSKDHRDHQAGFDAPDLWAMVRERDIELLDESYQECLYLYDTTPEPVVSGVNGIQSDKLTRIATLYSS